MSHSERALTLIMRISAVILMTALVPTVMPFAWMNAVHGYLGLGELPDIPITHYLTRSLSAMYAMHGALVFFVSSNVHRYLSVVKCLAILGILFGVGMIVLDISIGFPLLWVIGEGLSITILGFLLLWLASRIQADPAAEDHQR